MAKVSYMMVPSLTHKRQYTTGDVIAVSGSYDKNGGSQTTS